MTERTNIAVIGYSGIGRIHSANYREIPLLYPGTIPYPVLHTVCTSRPESAATAQQEAGFMHATTEIEAVIENPEIDVVDVALPNHLHRSVVEAALQQGKHVYCEKPLAGTVDDARAIARAVSGTNRSFFGMVFQYRFFPAILRAKELIEEGRIGRVYTFRAKYLHTGYQNADRPLTWRMKKTEGGSGALGDLGTHVIDLVRYLLGEFSSVQGTLETFITERPLVEDRAKKGPVTVDDVAWITARMASGAVGSIEASRFATGTADDLKIQIHGEKGALLFDLMDPGFLQFYDETATGGSYGGSRGWQRIETLTNYPGAKVHPPRNPIGWLRSHGESQYRFLEALRDGREPSPGIADGLRTQLVLEAVQRSGDTGGTWTDVDLE